MLINWFTVGAQIVNFLILVALLKKFLYGPIVRAMDAREERIAERLRDAQRQKEKAEAEAEEYSRKNRELDARREGMMREAKEKANEVRRDLVERVQREVEEKKNGWLEMVKNEKEAFIRDLRTRTAQGVLNISRQALKDLANRDMERQLVEVFLEKLDQADPEQIAGLDRSLQEEKEITVCTVFELQDSLRDRLMEGVQHWTGRKANVHFEVSKDLLGGIELRSNGRKVAWSLKDYLDSLESDVRAFLDEQTAESRSRESESRS